MNWNAEARLEADVRTKRAELTGVCRALLDAPPSLGADIRLREWAGRALVALLNPDGPPWGRGT